MATTVLCHKRVLPPQTSAHTQVCAYLHVCMRAQIHVHFHRYTYITIYRCRRRQGKESSSTHTHTSEALPAYTYTQTFTHTHARNNGRIFALCGQADSERYTHTQTHADPMREQERERGRARQPGPAISCRTMCSRRNQRGQLLLLLLPLAAFAGSENKSWKKMPNWLAKGEYDKKIR